MKKFLIKYSLFITPILIFLLVLEIVSQRNDRLSIGHQKKYLDNNKLELKGALFGPSHSWRGVHPKYLDQDIASLALSGSSPNVDYLLYEYTKEIINPKFLIFDLSLAYLRRHNDMEWIKNKKLPFYFSNIDGNELKDLFITQYPLRRDITHLLKNERRFDKWGFEIDIPQTKNTFAQLNFQDSLIIQDKRTKDVIAEHKKMAKKTNVKSNIDLYKKIVNECTSKGIKIIFISPPKYHIYNNKIDINKEYSTERMTFLSEVVDNKSCFFLNFEDTFENNARLFFNVNHLNVEGARVFTKELNKALEKILE